MENHLEDCRTSFGARNPRPAETKKKTKKAGFLYEMAGSETIECTVSFPFDPPFAMVLFGAGVTEDPTRTSRATSF